MYLLNSLLPIFLIIALGKTLCRTGFFSENLAKSLSRLTYWIALPALLIDKVSNATFNSSDISRLSLLLVLATLGSVLIGYTATFILKLDRRSTGAFVQGSMRSNNAFIGLPVIIYSMSAINPNIAALATVALAPSILFYNFLSVLILMTHGDRKKMNPGATVLLFIKQLLLNPLLIACAIGLLLNGLKIALPVAIQSTLKALGDTSLALALLSIGASLSFKGIRTGLITSITASGIKVFVQPLIGLGLAVLWNIPPVERQILLIYLACPTAVASYVMADIFNSDRDLAAHIIVISTLLSIASLTAVLALGG